jgi:glycosyltransferase involved in cell wall biosynthesis
VNVALVHDYLTQRGGAERVVLSMLKAFPSAPLYTSLFDPAGTFPEFADADVRTLSLDRIGLLRRSHRLALPLLAASFGRLEVQTDVTLCSSSGWAHGARITGRKIVYCHALARWLYQPGRYLRDGRPAARAALRVLRPYLVRWDCRAAQTAHRYLANSSAVRDQVQAAYGIGAEVLHPPYGLDPEGPRQPVDGLEPGFVLCVSRLVQSKNVDAVVEAFAHLPTERLVVVGQGPEAARLLQASGSNVVLLGNVPDDQLRWLYASSVGAVSASYEDYGLTPLEAAAFGKPAAVLRFGGFLDTVREGETGIFFSEPTPAAISDGVRRFLDNKWQASVLQLHAEQFSEARFVARLRAVVAEEAEDARA